MNFADGVIYNFRGLWFSLRQPRLLFWGTVRFLAVVVITLAAAGFILLYHQAILGALWAKPENSWIAYLWQAVSWLLSIFLVGVSAILSYLVSQVLFAVVIMDRMSRITEAKVTGRVEEPVKMPLWSLFVHLMRQEIPRTLVPVAVSLFFMVFGWFVLLGPVLTIASSCVAVVFLAWDNTDLLPARRLVPFKERFRFLAKTLPFHLGFGLPFLIPGLNLILLSFAPVGGTLYYLQKKR